MADNQSFFDQFFHYASRAIIIVPIIVIIIALILKFGNKDIRKQTSSEEIIPSVKPTIETKPSVKVNLQGPFICLFTTQGATISAYIKDKKILAQTINKSGTKNYLLNGDCLYTWSLNVFSGEKKCGLSQYINTFETLSSIGITNFSSLTKLIPATSESAVMGLINSCKKEEIENKYIFELPKYVLFK
jgi:hypothetical protein